MFSLFVFVLEISGQRGDLILSWIARFATHFYIPYNLSPFTKIPCSYAYVQNRKIFS
jgi:hypothetical protein